MDVTSIIESGSYLLIALIIYAESGMLIGFFLPGDTLLLTAGVFAAQGKLSLWLIIAIIAVCAILGDNTGYYIGKIMGKRLFRKKDGILFRQEYVERAEQFFEKYGAKTMLIAHYVPIVRSFAPLVAGVGHMPRWKFFVYDAVGNISWAIIITLLGYWFGSKIPNMDHYILPAVGIAVCISFAPMVWHIVGDKKARQKIAARYRAFRSNKSSAEDEDKS
jgi:membrane-associated protein